eukprot:5535427-Pleurochrysis_carterae.AAC.1
MLLAACCNLSLLIADLHCRQRVTAACIFASVLCASQVQACCTTPRDRAARHCPTARRKGHRRGQKAQEDGGHAREEVRATADQDRGGGELARIDPEAAHG